jgi:hypothetical protein
MHRGRALAQISALLNGQTARNFDWLEILTLLNEELVTPQFCARLHEAELPAGVSAFLQQVRARNRERNESLMRTLGDVGKVLNGVNIEPGLLKGAAFMALVGERGKDRMMSDLDLLVRPEEFGCAVSALSRAGFHITEDKRDIERHPVIALARLVDAGGVDLHQRAPGGEIVSDLRERCVPVELAGARFAAPPAHLQVLISVWHDQWHEGRFWRGGFHLRHLMDIALLAENPGIEWRKAFALCADGVQRLGLRAQALAARRLVNADVPAEAIEGFWPAFAYHRQRIQYVWPAINAPLRGVGLTRAVWRPLSQRMTRTKVVSPSG